MNLWMSLGSRACLTVSVAAGLAGSVHASGLGRGRTYTATGAPTVIHAPARQFYGGFASGPAVHSAALASPPASFDPRIVQTNTIRYVPARPVLAARPGRTALIRRHRHR